ncbi:RNase H domain-containing protein [Trichonephila clavipes]|uniref:RNase H domain-containing protein n=1 Tax=Trichonephila clavipes TaxID=2585209 RepID=A0A8X6RYA8_TRICX|nr:RNase H domain-containing protein [Trichonephila clavipes]
MDLVILNHGQVVPPRDLSWNPLLLLHQREDASALAIFNVHRPSLHGSTSVTKLQKLEKVQLSADRIITGLKITCPRDIVLFEVDLQPLSLRRRACLTKYYNKLRSLDSRNRTSAYFKDWCNNQRLWRNSPFSQMVPFNLTIELPLHVNKQADFPAYLKQLVLERIEGIPIDAVQVYTDGSRNDYYRSGSGIYIKSQDHILRIQRRNPDDCSVFRSELIAIDEALGSLASLPTGKEIWILSDSRSAIQHLSNWQTGHAYSHSRVPRAHQAGSSRPSLTGVRLSESVRWHGPGLALLTNGGLQQQHEKNLLAYEGLKNYSKAIGDEPRHSGPRSRDEEETAGNPSPNFYTKPMGGRLSHDTCLLYAEGVQRHKDRVFCKEKRDFGFVNRKCP